MAFPDPTVDGNETHSIGDKTWSWDGEKWVLMKIEESFTFQKNDPITVVTQGNSVTYGIDTSTLEEIFKV